MNELPVIGSRAALYSKGCGITRKGGWGGGGGKSLQIALRKCMAETYSTSKKRFCREINAFVSTVLSEIDLGSEVYAFLLA